MEAWVVAVVLRLMGSLKCVPRRDIWLGSLANIIQSPNGVFDGDV